MDTKKINKIEAVIPQLPKRKKVAAYARVSMESERLQHSLSAQVSYYSNLIQKNPEWEYAGVYADDGLTGTKSTRAEFQRMLADCDAGKIDIVLTKSISRFARNTVDLLNTVRHLKELGIEVRFEKERINSLSGDGEVMLSLLASFAQEEVRSLSDNVKWGTRKRFEKGQPNGKFRCYGYRWEGDEMVIVPEEAEVVKRIYQNFLNGKSRLETERELAAEGITTRDGKRWVDSNIKVVLTNVTYTGNLLLQKEFIEDPITKKRRKNKGQLPQYFVEETHPAIIDKETFDYVQAEIARRKELGAFANKSLNITCFTSKIKCSECDRSYVRNVRANMAKNSTYGDKVVTWCCGTTKKKGGRCASRDIPERVLRSVCADAMGMTEFDEEAFQEQVESITAFPERTLEFHFRDGHTASRIWESTARKDCWDLKQKTIQKAWVRDYMASGKDDRFSPFTTRITCGCCGSPCRRQTQKCKSAENGKTAYWRCSKGGCGIHGIREEELMEISAGILKSVSFDPDLFRTAIDHITMEENGVLNFTFADGKTESATYSTRKRGTAWTPEQRAKFSRSAKAAYTPERRKATSERMKQLRKVKKWSKREK